MHSTVRVQYIHTSTQLQPSTQGPVIHLYLHLLSLSVSLCLFL